MIWLDWILKLRRIYQCYCLISCRKIRLLNKQIDCFDPASTRSAYWVSTIDYVGYNFVATTKWMQIDMCTGFYRRLCIHTMQALERSRYGFVRITSTEPLRRNKYKFMCGILSSTVQDCGRTMVKPLRRKEIFRQDSDESIYAQCSVRQTYSSCNFLFSRCNLKASLRYSTSRDNVSGIDIRWK